jgi:CP family cyanate transporter-like MFS transporter
MSEALMGSRRSQVLVGSATMLVAFNLRPPLTSVGPLLTRIVAETGLSASGAAVLTTLPVLCLGLGGGLGPITTRRIGLDRGILIGLLIIAAGLLVRGLGGLVALFAGAAISGIGIGLAGVLLPALVKRDFARHAGRATGLYTMTLCIGAAAGTGLSLPLMSLLGIGWPGALASWAVAALFAAAVWLPFAMGRPATSAVGSTLSTAPGPKLWRDPLAWQVTGFMGLQSSLAYILFGWLPALLQSVGLEPLDAGYVAAITTLGQAPGALVIASLAGKSRDQRGWIVGVLLATLASFIAVAFGPHVLLIPAGLLLGLMIGGCFGLGLTLIVLRASDARGAAALSAMAQGIGYALASLGPFGFGLAHEATGGWTMPAGLFAAIVFFALVCGLGAGRNRHVGQAARGP